MTQLTFFFGGRGVAFILFTTSTFLYDYDSK